MGKRTALYERHLSSHAKMIDFAGWELPIHYGSQLAEHQCVREDAGVFDVSHMTIIDLEGQGVSSYLSFILANNIARLSAGEALYSCMLNEEGGVLDDLIVYKIRDDFYRLVVNAATSAKDLAWMEQQLNNYSLKLIQRKDLAMLATQGPRTVEKVTALFGAEAKKLKDLKPFQTTAFHHYFVARTGYTGEDGFEWILPAEEAASFWQQLIEQGFSPCGLGARDTLRLEAGLNLYGSDMDETVSPLESNLSWTVAWEPRERKFVGRQALEQQLREGVQKVLLGLVLEEGGIPRSHQKVVLSAVGEGEITSGSFSPTLKMGIALARIPRTELQSCFVEIRGKLIPAKVVKPPFVKQGKKVFQECSPKQILNKEDKIENE